jgi:hypothetical protein
MSFFQWIAYGLNKTSSSFIDLESSLFLIVIHLLEVLPGKK